jgi:hypothetical protein
MLVNGINLLRNLALLKQERSLMFFSSKDDTLLGDNTYVNGKVPIEEPVLLMASTAYSICWSLPSGVKVVVRWSYLRDI